jgi:FhuF 2Fe-2S C-terminal domain
LAATATRYGFDRQTFAGVLWWYSVSSVLLGPPVSSVVRGGPVADPALESMVLYSHRDGRVLDARSTAVIPLSALGSRLHDALGTAITEVAAASGAPQPALWAIATDSLANQVLWAGADPAASTELATELADAVGPPLPTPRYVTVGGTPVVRRASCCLIYQAPGQSKCVSCPRQHPDERARRLRAAFGQGGGSR